MVITSLIFDYHPVRYGNYQVENNLPPSRLENLPAKRSKMEGFAKNLPVGILRVVIFSDGLPVSEFGVLKKKLCLNMIFR